MEQENIMQSFMDMWEDVADAQVAADATKLAQDFKTKVGQQITKKVGATPNATPNAPKLVNQAVVDAAKVDPVAASKALNTTVKAMKKENRFPTLQQWREAGCGCGAGTPVNGDHIDGSWQGAVGGGKLSSVGDVKMKKKSNKK